MQMKSDFRERQPIGVKSVEPSLFIAASDRGKMNEKFILAVRNCPIMYDMSPCTFSGTRRADSEPEWFRELGFAHLLQLDSRDSTGHSLFLIHL